MCRVGCSYNYSRWSYDHESFAARQLLDFAPGVRSGSANPLRIKHSHSTAVLVSMQVSSAKTVQMPYAHQGPWMGRGDTAPVRIDVLLVSQCTRMENSRTRLMLELGNLKLCLYRPPFDKYSWIAWGGICEGVRCLPIISTF